MAIDLFLTIPGIDGESLDAHHRDAIEVLSWSWGVDDGAAEGVEKVTFRPLVVLKHVDRSTPQLFTACCTGTRLESAVLSVRKAAAMPFDYLRVTLENVLVSSLAIAEPDGDRLTEELALTFTKVTIDYTPDRPDGSAGQTATAWWDLRPPMVD